MAKTSISKKVEEPVEVETESTTPKEEKESPMKQVRSNSKRDEGFSLSGDVTVLIPGKREGENTGQPVVLENKVYKQLITPDKGKEKSIFSILVEDGTFSVSDVKNA